MTTYTFTGLRVTSTSGNPTAIATQTMNWTTSDVFFFRYTMDDPQAGAFSDITVAPTLGTFHFAQTGATRHSLNGFASVAEWSWTDSEGDARKTMILKIEGLTANVADYYVMAGAALPTFANAAAFDAFLDDLDGQTSVITGTTNPVRPGTNITMSRFEGITSETENDIFIGAEGIDNWSVVQLRTGDGDDSVEGLSGVDRVDAGDGNDFVRGNGGNDSLIGGDNNDTMLGDAGNDTVLGGNNNDLLFGGADNDLVKGGKGNDSLNGDDGDDRLEGEVGADALFGGEGNDTLFGSIGNDSLSGGAGNNNLSGGKGADVLIAGSGDDTLNGGEGNDDLNAGDGTNRLFGANGNDLMSGGSGDDLLEGGNGDDTMDGGAGNDLMRGGAGADVFTAGAGDDIMTGNAGADTFEFFVGSDNDIITDFDVAADVIVLSEEYGDSLAAILEFVGEGEIAGSVFFDFGEGDTLTLLRSTVDSLTEDNFIFV